MVSSNFVLLRRWYNMVFLGLHLVHWLVVRLDWDVHWLGTILDELRLFTCTLIDLSHVTLRLLQELLLGGKLYKTLRHCLVNYIWLKSIISKDESPAGLWNN